MIFERLLVIIAEVTLFFNLHCLLIKSCIFQLSFKVCAEFYAWLIRVLENLLSGTVVKNLPANA